MIILTNMVALMQEKTKILDDNLEYIVQEEDREFG